MENKDINFANKYNTHSFSVCVATHLGVQKAILLQNIDFWVRHNEANEKHFHDGLYWTFNTSSAFAKLFPYIPEKTIAMYLKQLEDEDYIVSSKAYNKNPFDRTKWYALTQKYYDIFNPTISEFQKWNTEAQKSNAGIQNSVYEYQKSNAEIQNSYTDINTNINITDINTDISFFSAPVGAVLENETVIDFLNKNLEATESICEAPIESRNPNPQVAPAPLPQELAPITVAVLTVLAKEWGCNGKSENYAGEFYHYWEAKDWQVNEKGAKMRNAESYFKKFVEAKKPKEKAPHLAYQDCVKIFYERHQELHQREYTKFEAKDGKAMNDIIQKLEIEMKNKVKKKQALDNTIPLEQIEIAPIEVAKVFKFVLKEHKIPWIDDNFSPTNINSKFNDLINSIRQTNGNTTRNTNQSTNRAQSTEDIARRAMEIMRTKGHNV